MVGEGECAWKADKFVTVGACVWLVVALVGWVEAEMEMVVNKNVRQSQEELVACRVMPEHFPSVR